MQDLPRVYLDNGAVAQLGRRGLWVKRNAVIRVDPGVQDGGLVALTDKRGVDVLAYGFYAFGEKAQRVRVLGFGEAPKVGEREFEAALFENRIDAAWRFRRALPSLKEEATNCFRLFHAEADGIGGLVIDWFDGVAVVQANTRALENRSSKLIDALKSLPGCKTIVLNRRDSQRTREGLERSGVEVVHGEVSETLSVRELGFSYEISVLEGQKTGHYCDQRENRARFGQLASALKSEREQPLKVLDVCAYTGGFALHAARAMGDAGEIHAIDSSANALAQCAKHFELNALKTQLHTHAGDMVESMRALRKQKLRFDLISLDPPKMVGGKQSENAAKRAYTELNTLAITMLAPGGVLMTHSCSGALDRESFLQIVDQAASDGHRKLRLLGEGGQSADHPVNLHHPASRYLKTAIVAAE